MTAVELRLHSIDVSLGGIRETLVDHGKRLDRIERHLDPVDTNA